MSPTHVPAALLAVLLSAAPAAAQDVDLKLAYQTCLSYRTPTGGYLPGFEACPGIAARYVQEKLAAVEAEVRSQPVDADKSAADQKIVKGNKK